MPNDRFNGYNVGVTGPAINAFAITPSDSTDLPETTRAINVAAAGNVAVRMMGQTTPVTLYVAAGIPFPIRVDRVLATGTTATGIVGLV